MENVKKYAKAKQIKMEVYLLEWDEYAVWITIQTIHCTQFKYAGYSNSFQGPKLKSIVLKPSFGNPVP